MLNVPRSTFDDVIVKWKRQESTEPNHCSGRPKKLTDRDLQTLKRTVKNNRQSDLSTIAKEFRLNSDTELTDRAIQREVI